MLFNFYIFFVVWDLVDCFEVLAFGGVFLFCSVSLFFSLVFGLACSCFSVVMAYEVLRFVLFMVFALR